MYAYNGVVKDDNTPKSIHPIKMSLNCDQPERSTLFLS